MGPLANGDWAHGGYAAATRVNERFCFHVPDGLDNETAAPMMCVAAPNTLATVLTWPRAGAPVSPSTRRSSVTVPDPAPKSALCAWFTQQIGAAQR
jgi:NADPH:quinone reductase-like Zn-dependent oxidoreductase